MISRVLEPEVMDTPQEAAEYDAMDHSEVNRVFVDDLLIALNAGGDASALSSETTSALRVLDVGTGTALIPIELCKRREFSGQVVGVDLADEMLRIARRNVDQSQLQSRIRVERIDAKSLPCPDAEFDIVMSNSIVHHIPDPLGVLREMVRVLKEGGLLFVRDLLRPETEAEIETLVLAHAGEETAYSQQLFRQSLWAALTVGEMQALARRVGIDDACVRQTSNRHWTLAWRRPSPSGG